MTRAFALSLAPHIKVNEFAPGMVETRWIEGFTKEFYDKHYEETPLGRLAKPEGVAHAILGFVGNDFITGKTLIMDGGRTLV